MSAERDNLLVAEYDVRRTEEAFAALVRQHVNLVFATALRQVGDAGAAEEITQNVFVALAQASGKLKSHPTIAGWLHRTTLNKSREWFRAEMRRRHREQVAVSLELARTEGDSVWSPLVPLLDEALLKLREADRTAVIMHYMEGQTFQEVGSALGVGEDTARKRVARCLEKLTHFFQRRGFATPSLAVGTPLFALAAHTAPAELADSAAAAGLAAANTTASTSTLTILKGALKIMAWTHTKTAIVISAAAILAATSTTVVGVKLARAHHRAVEPANDLSPVVMNSTVDIQADGKVLFQLTLEETNTTSRTIDPVNADSINDAEEIYRVADESGQPMKFTRRPRGGFFITLNKPVPPGGSISYSVEGSVVGGLIQSKGMGEYAVEINGNVGNATETHLVQVWRLPAGATLLGKVRGMEAGTNGGQIELHIDRMLPPNGTYPVGFHYRLPASGN